MCDLFLKLAAAAPRSADEQISGRFTVSPLLFTYVPLSVHFGLDCCCCGVGSPKVFEEFARTIQEAVLPRGQGLKNESVHERHWRSLFVRLSGGPYTKGRDQKNSEKYTPEWPR
jgi:hypothetical protein